METTCNHVSAPQPTHKKKNSGGPGGGDGFLDFDEVAALVRGALGISTDALSDGDLKTVRCPPPPPFPNSSRAASELFGMCFLFFASHHPCPSPPCVAPASLLCRSCDGQIFRVMDDDGSGTVNRGEFAEFIKKGRRAMVGLRGGPSIFSREFPFEKYNFFSGKESKDWVHYPIARTRERGWRDGGSGGELVKSVEVR